MTPLDRTRLEKALADHGFDLTPAVRGDWLLGRSTQHPIEIWLRYAPDGAIVLACASQKLRAVLAREGYACLDEADAPAQRSWQLSSADYPAFHRALGRLAALARSLPNQVAERFRTATRDLPQRTEAERLVVQRIGQDLFRAALIDYWQGRCAVTGLDVVPLLRASHIKPWAECASDEERLDVFNGLLLAPQLDAMFDGGWMTFDDDAAMRVAAALTPEHLRLLGVWPDACLAIVTDEHRAYLTYHRAHRFRG